MARPYTLTEALPRESTLPLIMPIFSDLLTKQIEENAERTAIVYHDILLSYRQLGEEITAIAAFFQERGIQKGDRVAIYSSNKFPLLLIHLGVMRCGGVPVVLNPSFTEDEMCYFLCDSAARFVCASEDTMSTLHNIQKNCPAIEKIFPHTDTPNLHTNHTLQPVDIIADDHCFILYSSGTTGRPKGVVHTHGNVAASLLSLQQTWRFTEEDVLLNVLPLFHLHGLSFGAHLSLISGASMIVEDTFLHAMEKIGDATIFMAIPTIYYAFLRRREKFIQEARTWSKTRLFTCGSAPLRPEVLPELEAIIGRKIINRYGMTEAHVITSIPLDGPFVWGSVGKPINGIEMRIVDDHGNVLSPGDITENGEPRTGEIRVRGANLFHQYWNKPEETKKAFDAEGFFLTGDIGYQNADELLMLLGRKDDLIIVDGENVYPPIIERVLNEFPHVKESAVVGIPNQKSGEAVIAFIVPESNVDVRQLQIYCKEKLAHYQRPSRIELIEALPRNTMGKVLKYVLRKRSL